MRIGLNPQTSKPDILAPSLRELAPVRTLVTERGTIAPGSGYLQSPLRHFVTPPPETPLRGWGRQVLTSG